MTSSSWRLARARGITGTDKLRLMLALMRLQRAGFRVPAGMTVAAWLSQTRQSPRLVTGFWQPLVLAALNTPLGVADMATLARVLRDSLAGARDASDLLLPRPPTLAAQVRRLVAQAPARGWQSADFEQALGTSGATLRRRLADEGTPLREAIAQSRLACALELLYTTRSPVKTVAHRVGYQSVESFARRFRERYGLEATAIGNAVAESA